MFTLRQMDDGRWEVVDEGDRVVATLDHIDMLGLDGTALSVDPASVVAAVDPPETFHWRGVLTLEGATTGDGRGADPGAWSWETPFPLTWQREGGGHEGATVVGTVWEVERQDGEIVGRGTFDLGSIEGREAARHVGEELTTDVSIEPDSIEVELRVAAEVAEEWLGGDEAGMDEDGEELPTDDEGNVVLGQFAHDDVLEIVTAGRIRTLALVTTAAYDEATIELDGVALDELLANAPDTDEPALVAAGTWLPPAAFFDDPELDGPTALTVDDDGRLYGHLATWGTCHIGRQDSCLTPPRSESGYAYFATGATRAECSSCDGDVVTIPTGTITMDTGHASLSSSPRAAAAHYDDTGYAVADVAIGEDAHGIWIAGTLRQGVDDTARRALEGSSLSGDWRKIGGALELVATLAVNVPGFPIPRTLAASGAAAYDARPRAQLDADEPVALVAAGMVTRDTSDQPTVSGTLAELVALNKVMARQLARGMRADVHARPVRPAPPVDVDALRARVHDR